MARTILIILLGLTAGELGCVPESSVPERAALREEVEDPARVCLTSYDCGGAEHCVEGLCTPASAVCAP